MGATVTSTVSGFVARSSASRLDIFFGSRSPLGDADALLGDADAQERVPPAMSTLDNTLVTTGGLRSCATGLCKMRSCATGLKSHAAPTAHANTATHATMRHQWILYGDPRSILPHFRQPTFPEPETLPEKLACGANSTVASSSRISPLPVQFSSVSVAPDSTRRPFAPTVTG